MPHSEGFRIATADRIVKSCSRIVKTPDFPRIVRCVMIGVMKDLIQECRATLAAAEDSVCLERARLVTEIYATQEGLPNALLRAKAFAHVLDHMTLDLRTNPIFAGNTSSRPRAWMLVPEYGFLVPRQAPIENEKLAGFLDGAAIPDDLRRFWRERAMKRHAGIGHLAVDLGRVLDEGVAGVLAELARHDGERDPARRAFREACGITLRALVRWAHRYAREARRQAKALPAGARKAALLRVARACRHVPEKPARTLFEALQAIVLVQLAIHIEGHGYSVSIGGLDRLLARFHTGAPDTVDLLCAFFLKLHANALWGSHSKTQAITIGGVDRMRRDACNAMTRDVLTACERIRVTDPHVFLRWHENIAPEIKRQSTTMLLNGMSMPMLISDEATVAGFVGAGIPAEDAWDYCVIGCNELGIPGKLRWRTVLGMNGVNLLCQALLDHAARPAPADLEQVWARLCETTESYVGRTVGGAQAANAAFVARAQTPFTSALMHGCIARGRDLHEKMAYDCAFTLELGFTNLVNAMAAIETLVSSSKAAGLHELIEALRANFEGYEQVRACLLNAPKWGNDDARVDKWARKWLALRTELLARTGRRYGVGPILSSHVTRSLHHTAGRALGASPDGRRAGDPLADSIGAPSGTAAGGPTALLNSVRKMDAPRFWPGGYNLNLCLHKTALPAERDTGILESLIEGFLSHGGQELQINCLDAAALRKAKADPDGHADLMVRVAGFNVLFSRLAEKLQDELIQRAEAAR